MCICPVDWWFASVLVSHFIYWLLRGYGVSLSLSLLHSLTRFLSLCLYLCNFYSSFTLVKVKKKLHSKIEFLFHFHKKNMLNEKKEKNKKTRGKKWWWWWWRRRRQSLICYKTLRFTFIFLFYYFIYIFISLTSMVCRWGILWVCKRCFFWCLLCLPCTVVVCSLATIYQNMKFFKKTTTV